MTYGQRRKLSILLNFCAEQKITGTRVEEKDGRFFLYRNEKKEFSGSYDEMSQFLTHLADMLEIVNSRTAKAAGKQMAKKLARKYPNE